MLWSKRAALFLLLTTSANSAFGTDYTVTVGQVGGGLGFNPRTLTVHPGDKIIFSNAGGRHNAKSVDPSFPFSCADNNCLNAPASNTLWTAEVIVPDSALGKTIAYYCELHGTPTSGMNGSITIENPTPVTLQGFDVQ